VDAGDSRDESDDDDDDNIVDRHGYSNGWRMGEQEEVVEEKRCKVHSSSWSNRCMFMAVARPFTHSI